MAAQRYRVERPEIVGLVLPTGHLLELRNNFGQVIHILTSQTQTSIIWHRCKPTM